MNYMSAVILGVVLAGTACGSTPSQPLLTSAQVPAARGSVDVSEGQNRNTKLRIRVEHLAPPSAIGGAAYVAWARPFDGTPAQPLGALQVDDKLNGELETVTALRVFELLVTPEPSPQVPAPTGTPVLRSTIQR